MARIHEAIKWGLAAVVIQGHYLPERQRKAVTLTSGMMEGVIRLFVNILLEEVELDLKHLLAKHLRRRHSGTWWFQLPQNVQRVARTRYEWSRATLGERRVFRFPDISWLTFGDTLKALDSMQDADWKKCLGAETKQKRTFIRLAKRVKSFRDYHIAHPKPREITTAEMIRLCETTRRLASGLCPREWEQACHIVHNERNFLIPLNSTEPDRVLPVRNSYRKKLLKWWDSRYRYGPKWRTGA